MLNRTKTTSILACTLVVISYLLSRQVHRAFWAPFTGGTGVWLHNGGLDASSGPWDLHEQTEAGSNGSYVQVDEPEDGAETTAKRLESTALIATNTSQGKESEVVFVKKGKILASENYFQLALDGHFPIAEELGQMKIMKTYIALHSKQVLLRERNECASIQDCPAIQARKFIVGRYSCPLEAGNRIHKALNSLIWAVLTNRTFMLDYFDEQACIEEGYSSTYECSQEGRKDVCDEILTISTWVPVWSEWKISLDLPNPPIRSHRSDAINLTVPYDRPDGLQVFTVGHQINQEAYFSLKFKQYWWYQLGTSEAQSRIKQLFAPDLFASERKLARVTHFFTYGMLFEALFTLSETLLPDPELVADPSNANTFVIHSRHPLPSLDGNDIALEVICIDQLLNHSTLPCTFYIMSDRAKTSELLNQYIANISCTPISVNHTQRGRGLHAEHGPFAGVGYFRDWALARNARHGMIAVHKHGRPHKGIRSSSALVRESIEFRRIMESPSIANLTRMTNCYQPHLANSNF
jgi:hypothetical protein